MNKSVDASFILTEVEPTSSGLRYQCLVYGDKHNIHRDGIHLRTPNIIKDVVEDDGCRYLYTRSGKYCVIADRTGVNHANVI